MHILPLDEQKNQCACLGERGRLAPIPLLSSPHFSPLFRKRIMVLFLLMLMTPTLKSSSGERRVVCKGLAGPTYLPS